MHREQHGNGRAPHSICGACPRWRHPISRLPAQEGVQPSQRGHDTSGELQAQQRRRNASEPAQSATGHHRSVADGQRGTRGLRHGCPAHPPTADDGLGKQVPTNAEPQQIRSLAAQATRVAGDGAVTAKSSTISGDPATTRGFYDARRRIPRYGYGSEVNAQMRGGPGFPGSPRMGGATWWRPSWPPRRSWRQAVA